MRQIRKGTFETNSSSVHSICITKEMTNVALPESLYFGFGNFGWEWDCHDTPEIKAAYLHTAIYELYKDVEVKKLVGNLSDILSKYGVKTEFAEPPKTCKYFNMGYIDHVEDLNEFVTDVLSDETRLIKYLFSVDSFILTGNDNDDEMLAKACDFIPNYECEMYEKGN